MINKPSRRLENKLQRQGFLNIAGIDEVGRGAWAGPLVAAAVILPHNYKIKDVKDSKKLSAKTREQLFLKITKNAIQYSISIISHNIIDQIGIQQANIKAFRNTITKLKIKPNYLLIDGKEISTHPLPYEYLVSGDNKITSIAAASIVAKVTRDYIMQEYNKRFPEYGFSQHKGYGTLFHRQAISKHGLTTIHRKSFKPISKHT